MFHGRRLGAEFGGRKKILFRHRLYFLCVCLSLQIYNIYDPFLDQKPPSETCFSQFVLCITSNNSTSQNIGGTDAWAVPTHQIWGDRPPSPLSLRSWFVIAVENHWIKCISVK